MAACSGDIIIPAENYPKKPLIFDGNTTLEIFLLEKEAASCEMLQKKPSYLGNDIQPINRIKADKLNEDNEVVLDLNKISPHIHLVFVRAIDLTINKVYAVFCQDFKITPGKTSHLHVMLEEYPDS